MDIDFGVIIGLIGVVCTAGILCLSYVGAYFLGHSRARRERELQRGAPGGRDDAIGDQLERMVRIEGALGSMAQAIERLTDTQRIALLERMRAPGGQDSRAAARGPSHNTPA